MSEKEPASNVNADEGKTPKEITAERVAKVKPKSLKQISQEIAVRHRFVPYEKETINDEGFALTGSALKEYTISRNLDNSLPDLSINKVQGKRIHQVFNDLNKSYKFIGAALRNNSSMISDPEEISSIPRSTKVHVTPEISSKLGFTFTDNNPKEKFITAKWINLTPVLAPISFSAPDNPVLIAIEQHLAHVNLETESGGETEEYSLSPLSELEDSGNAGSDIAARIDELLKRLEEGGTEGEVYPLDLKSKRQTNLYQSLGSKYERPLNYSPADAIAYYDFYDLKLAWDPLWTYCKKVSDQSLEYSMPKVMVNFHEDINIVVWNKYCQGIEKLGGDWKEIERKTAFALIYYIFYKMLNDKLDSTLAYNDVTLEELIKITGWNGAWNEYYSLVRLINQQGVFSMQAAEQKKQDMLEKHNTSKSSIVNDILIVANEEHEIKTLYFGTPSTLGYPAKVFAPGSINYGLLVNYRQQWIPESWQVGELVQTIPLTPKESRRYTKKTIVSHKRSRKEIDNSLSIRKTDDTTNNRAESQIVQRAQESTSFDATTSGGFDVEIYEIGANANGSNTFKTTARNDSSESKRKMRQAVAKSAREFRNEHRIEVQIDESTRIEEFSENVISNPNDEITVTYLFYELQRQFSVTEALHNIQSVVLVANEVPSWDEIDWDWIKRHDWILKRCLMDDSFQPALDFVLEGKDALEIKLSALLQRKDDLSKLVESARIAVDSLATKSDLTNEELNMLSEILYTTIGKDDPLIKDVFDFLYGIDEGLKIEEYEHRVEGAVERLDRIEKMIKSKQDELSMQRNALDRAITEYNKVVLENHIKIRQVDRLIDHLRDNILYYMKAIWSHEPPDQRYLRLFNHEVPFWGYPDDDMDILVRVRSSSGTIDDILPGSPYEIILPPPDPQKEKKRKLVEIADIENLLGFKGNYMIFPLRVQSYVTAYMAQDFVGGLFDYRENEEEDLLSTSIEELINADRQPVPAGMSIQTYAVDPDPNGSISVHSLNDALNYIESHKGIRVPVEVKAKLNDLLEKGTLSPHSTPQRIIVPSNSLYIEALPGKHPILEDFKLRHRMIDVQKAIAEHKSMELENIRAEARLRGLDLSDKDIDQLIRIEGVDTDD